MYLSGRVLDDADIALVDATFPHPCHPPFLPRVPPSSSPSSFFRFSRHITIHLCRRHSSVTIRMYPLVMSPRYRCALLLCACISFFCFVFPPHLCIVYEIFDLSPFCITTDPCNPCVPLHLGNATSDLPAPNLIAFWRVRDRRYMYCFSLHRTISRLVAVVKLTMCSGLGVEIGFICTK